MTRPVDWKWSEVFSSRQKQIVILRARSESRASGPREFQRDSDDDAWFVEASSNIRMVVKFSDETNRIRFEIELPNQLTPDDRDVIRSLFDASYSVILGLKIDDQKLELARIGSFAAESAFDPDASGNGYRGIADSNTKARNLGSRRTERVAEIEIPTAEIASSEKNAKTPEKDGQAAGSPPGPGAGDRAGRVAAIKPPPAGGGVGTSVPETDAPAQIEQLSALILTSPLEKVDFQRGTDWLPDAATGHQGLLVQDRSRS